jgi:uncharacterized protein
MAPFMEGSVVAEILQNIRKSDVYQTCYQFLHDFELKDWYIASGFVQQTYYNARHGLDIHNAIKDIDIVYFDKDQPADTEREHRIERELTQLLKSRLKVDVKNQANVHTFYLKKFGYAIEPHRDIFSAIDSFPTTSTTIGITAGIHEERIYATHGLDDLYSLVLKPNKKQITKEIYEAKRKRVVANWPLVRIEEWDS